MGIGGSTSGLAVYDYTFHTASLANNASITFTKKGIICLGTTNVIDNNVNCSVEVTGNGGTNWVKSTSSGAAAFPTVIVTSDGMRFKNTTGGAITNIEVSGWSYEP